MKPGDVLEWEKSVSLLESWLDHPDRSKQWWKIESASVDAETAKQVEDAMNAAYECMMMSSEGRALQAEIVEAFMDPELTGGEPPTEDQRQQFIDRQLALMGLEKPS